MNTGEQLPMGLAQSKVSQQEENQQPVAHQQVQKTDPGATATSTGQGTWRNEMVLSDLEKALNALFKAHDQLNAATDRSGEGLSKMIESIRQSLRGLQRELSQVIYRLNNNR